MFFTSFLGLASFLTLPDLALRVHNDPAAGASQGLRFIGVQFTLDGWRLGGGRLRSSMTTALRAHSKSAAFSWYRIWGATSGTCNCLQPIRIHRYAEIQSKRQGSIEGPGNVARWHRDGEVTDIDLFVEEVGFAQTRTFIDRIYQHYWIYRTAYYGSDQAVDLLEGSDQYLKCRDKSLLAASAKWKS